MALGKFFPLPSFTVFSNTRELDVWASPSIPPQYHFTPGALFISIHLPNPLLV